ncbi:DUF397 domain-containing protein [Catenuloplanes japonicus]|uniref:DUF397 domain-containing protein n=1 Tax=Catenuloplanes japonicus TaxID=33876 RepID=UPI0038B97E84
MISQFSWFTSSYCDTSACVEVRGLPDGGVGLRDGKNPEGPYLRIPTAQWRSFTDFVKQEKFAR